MDGKGGDRAASCVVRRARLLLGLAQPREAGSLEPRKRLEKGPREVIAERCVRESSFERVPSSQRRGRADRSKMVPNLLSKPRLSGRDLVFTGRGNHRRENRAVVASSAI